MATASARLERATELLLPAFETPGRMLLEHPDARELYPRYLAAGSYVTLAMVPLMETALERATALADDDPVAARLAEYLEKHIPEELHGDEPGGELLGDLRAAGVDTRALLAAVPPRPVAALIGSLYFWIVQRHPVAILGLLALEAYHPHAPMVERLIDATRLPRDAFRQLLLHAKLDVVHADEFRAVLDRLPLDEQHEELISLAALQSMACLTEAWLDVVAAAEPQVV